MPDNLDYRYIADLVIKAQNNNSDAFAELYAASYDKQYRFAYRYLKDPYLAQDALQECYIQVFKNIKKLRDPLVFMSWLNQINFRVCFNLKWKQDRYNKELNNFEEDSKTYSSDLPGPEEAMAQNEEKKYILQQTLELPVLESQALIMKYYQNMKIDEIASVLEVSRSTVKRYLEAGRRHLGLKLKTAEGRGELDDI